MQENKMSSRSHIKATTSKQAAPSAILTTQFWRDTPSVITYLSSSRKNMALFLQRYAKTGFQLQKQPSSQKYMTIFAGGTHGGANR